MNTCRKPSTLALASWICALAVAISATVSAASGDTIDPTAPDSGSAKTSFEDYMVKINKSLPDIEKNRVSLKKSMNAIKIAEGIEDMRISAGAMAVGKKEYQLNPQFQQDYSRGYVVNSELSKKLAATGTLFSFGAEYQNLSMSGSSRNIVQIDPSTMAPVYGEMGFEKTYSYPSIFAEITQPILNNAFGILDRVYRKDAVMKYEIEKLKKLTGDDRALNGFKKMYFELIMYDAAVIIMTKSLDNAQEMERLIKSKYDLGMVDNDDYQNIKSTVFTYKTLLLNYRHARGVLKKEIEIYLGGDNFIPVYEELERYYERAKRHQYAPVAFGTTATGELMALTVENLDYIAAVKRNSVLPDFNLYGKVTLKSQEETFRDSASDMNDVDYRVGFVFRYPLGNNEKSGFLENAELSVVEMKKETEKASKEFGRLLASVIENASAAVERIVLIDGNINALQSRGATERKKYSQARLSLVNLIDTENKIAAERLNQAVEKRRLINLYFDYLSLTLRTK